MSKRGALAADRLSAKIDLAGQALHFGKPMTSLPTSLIRGAGALAEGAVLRLFVKTIALTIAIFLALGWLGEMVVDDHLAEPAERQEDGDREGYRLDEQAQHRAFGQRAGAADQRGREARHRLAEVKRLSRQVNLGAEAIRR